MQETAVISSLIQAAFEGRRIAPRPEMTPDDWKLILGICAAQHIHTFVHDALPSEGVPEDIREIWGAQAEANRTASALVDAVAQAQEKTWKRMGLEYALLKGPAVARLYPKPERRGCGDLDWWFADKESWRKALEPARRNAAGGITSDSDGDVNYVFNGVVIEHHRDWTHASSRRTRRLAGAPQTSDGRLGAEDTLLTLTCHILHHVAWDGANLKQITDLAAALRAYDGKYEKHAFAERLRLLGLQKWASLLAAVLPELTGLEEKYLPVAPKISDRNRERFLSVLFDEKPGLARRVALMWSCAPRECAARYFHLISGRLLKPLASA